MTGPRDPGLQPERTDLAWRRTALSAAACSAFLLHTAARNGWGWAVVPGLLVAVVTAVTTWARLRGRRRWPHGGGLGRLPLVIGFLVTLACLSAAPWLW